MIGYRLTPLLVTAVLIAAPLSGQTQDTLSRTSAPACSSCAGASRAGLAPQPRGESGDTTRRKAIEYSSLYHTSLTVHKIGSYLELPVFIAEYFVGQKLLKDEQTLGNQRSSLKGPHSAIAAGLGVLFTVNTVTGVYNLVASRKEPTGKTRRWVHSIAMLVADAGFLATAASAESARESDGGANTHRALAVGSMSLSVASTVMMWLWRD
ncbi:MAG: hypothetical protein V4558_09795 [Gemmatimonadota bacterium]